MALVAALSVGVVVTLLAGVATDTRPTCFRAIEWATAHRADLPTSLSRLSTFPVAYRGAIFVDLPAASKSNLWVTQLRELEGRAGLTDEQRRIVARAIELARPEAWEDNTQPPRQVVAKLETDVRAHFPPAQWRAFTILGANDDGILTPTTLPIMAREALIARTTALAYCSCSSSSDWCNESYYCQSAACQQQRGCGTLFLYSCDGHCFPAY